MSDFPKLQPGVVEAAVQSLHDAKLKLRATEAIIEGIIPLVENEETAKNLEETRESIARCVGVLSRIYNRNAREALKA